MFMQLVPAPDEGLLEAGRRAFTKYGYAGATLDRIAEEAGVSRVTLHRRGVSKDAILTILGRRALDEYRESLWPALTAAGTGAERMRMAIEAICEMAERNLELLVALRSQSDALFHSEAGAAEIRDDFAAPLARILRDGWSDGSLRSVDPDEIATVLFNLVGGTYVQLRTAHGWSARRARKGVVSVALDGVVA
jgi:AcrR family transcriptional regulator